MPYLLGTIAVIMIVGTLLLRGTVLIMGQRAGKFIHETHHTIEYISTTRSVPPQWIEPFQKKIRRLQQDDPHNQRKLARLGRSAQKTCLKKLDKSLKYAYNSSLVQDEETRDILLKKLTDVRKTWAEQDWSEIIGS